MFPLHQKQKVTRIINKQKQYDYEEVSDDPFRPADDDCRGQRYEL